MQPDDSESGADIIRLAILDAVMLGIDRRGEVLEAAYQAASRSELMAKLQELFAVDAAQAMAIGDLQIFRLTAQDRARLNQERTSLRSRLPDRTP